MHEGETSFSVEVLGFPRAADPEAVVRAVGASFRIPLEEARRLVQQAPITVKRGAPPSATQVLVNQLLELGADVSVRNDQTGVEKTYRVESPVDARSLVERDPVQPQLHLQPPRGDAQAPSPPARRGAVALASAMASFRRRP